MNKIFTLLFSTIFLLGSINAQEEIADSVELKEQLVISSIRASDDTPVSFTNLSLKEIEAHSFGQEPAFILLATPSVTAYSDAGSYSGYSYFRLRGIDQTRINMTLDGVPLNEPEDQGVYFSNYPDFFNSVESIQIQRGVGISTNGVASYGGSVNFQSPSLFRKKKMEFSGSYGSFNSYRAYAEYNSGLKNNFGIYARASYINSDGYKYRSAHDGISGFFGAGYVKGDHILKYTGFIGNQKNDMAWLGVSQSQIDLDPRSNTNAEEDDEFTQHLSKLQHTYTINSDAHLNTAIFYNYLNGNYDFDLNNFLGFPSTDEMYNYAFQSHFTGILTNFQLEKNNVLFNAGIQGNIYQREHNGSERALGNLYTNTGFKNEFSLFLKANYKWNDFNFLTDLQYRHASFNYEGGVDLEGIQWNFINPKFGITYSFNDQSKLYYSIGKSSREPTRTDIFLGNDDLVTDSDGEPLIASTQAEQVWDNELGYRRTSENYQFNINLYYMNFDNEIVLNGQFGPNGLPLNSSVAKSFRSGIEMDLLYKTKFGITSQTIASYNFSQISDNDEKFQPLLTPSLIFQENINYTIKDFTLGLTGRYQGKSYIDFANEYELDDYFVLDLLLSYQYKFAEINFRLNNLTNKQYFNNGQFDINGMPTYHIQAPLNFNVGVKITLD